MTEFKVPSKTRKPELPAEVAAAVTAGPASAPAAAPASERHSVLLQMTREDQALINQAYELTRHKNKQSFLVDTLRQALKAVIANG